MLVVSKDMARRIKQVVRGERGEREGQKCVWEHKKPQN